MRGFFEGVTTALVTPFKDGAIDFGSVKKLVGYQLDSGIEGFVVCGSTGEAATLNLNEKVKLLDFIISEVSGAVPVIVGSGTFNTAESVELTKHFEKSKPSGFLVVTPYYNKPPQRGMYEHFKKIAQSTELPIIVYNVPGRTAITLAPETVASLAGDFKNIVGVKEAAGDLEIIKKLKKLCASDFMVLSGDDGTFTEAMALGAQGVISVIAQTLPRWCLNAASVGRDSFRESPTRPNEAVIKLTKEIKEPCDLHFTESNPIPVKWALKEMGIIESDELRLPLMPLDQKFHQPLTDTLRKMGVL